MEAQIKITHGKEYTKPLFFYKGQYFFYIKVKSKGHLPFVSINRSIAIFR
jgi:hypothetical protein